MFSADSKTSKPYAAQPAGLAKVAFHSQLCAIAIFLTRSSSRQHTQSKNQKHQILCELIWDSQARFLAVKHLLVSNQEFPETVFASHLCTIAWLARRNSNQHTCVKFASPGTKKAKSQFFVRNSHPTVLKGQIEHKLTLMFG